jgi:hypothetical protein
MPLDRSTRVPAPRAGRLPGSIARRRTARGSRGSRSIIAGVGRSGEDPKTGFEPWGLVTLA